MTELLPYLKELISTSGISGYESGVRPIIEREWAPLTDQLNTSRLGSLHGLQRGTGAEPRPSIMVATHMDAIGLMVNAIVDGFLRVTTIGGIDTRVLSGQMVVVHARQDLPGMIVPTPARLLPASLQNGVVPLDYHLVDIGLLPDEVNRLVRIGDIVSFAGQPFEANGETLVGHSLDNRASVAALTICLEILRSRPHIWDVWAVATSQEEVGSRGGLTSAFQLQPSIGIAIDVTHGSAPGLPAHFTCPMGKGPTLGWGPVLHPYLFKTVKELAEKLEIPLTLEPIPRFTSTDADLMQIAGEGIPNLLLSIPLRYMHTPVEIVMLKDIERAGRLTAEFIASLDASFMDKMAWED